MAHRVRAGRMRALVLGMAIVVLAGCTAPAAAPTPALDAAAPSSPSQPSASPGEPPPEPIAAATPSPPSEPTPEPTPGPTPATPTATPPATPTPTPTVRPPPTPTSEPRRFSRTFDLTINSAPLFGSPEGAPERDCVRLYASDTTRIVTGNATLTWSPLSPTSERMVLEMRADPTWTASRVNGTSPIALPVADVALPPIARPPTQPAESTIASAWLKATLQSGGTPAVQQTLRLDVVFDLSGGAIDADVGGCARPS